MGCAKYSVIIFVPEANDIFKIQKFRVFRKLPSFSLVGPHLDPA